MDPRKVIASFALAATIGTATLIAVTKDTKTIDKEVILQPEKLAIQPDGGKTYVVEVITDAGIELRITTPKCLRKKPGAKCTKPDGGDPGDYNRAVGLVGPECQPVACSIVAGEDADKDEDERITEEKLKLSIELPKLDEQPITEPDGK